MQSLLSPLGLKGYPDYLRAAAMYTYLIARCHNSRKSTERDRSIQYHQTSCACVSDAETLFLKGIAFQVLFVLSDLERWVRSPRTSIDAAETRREPRIKGGWASLASATEASDPIK